MPTFNVNPSAHGASGVFFSQLRKVPDAPTISSALFPQLSEYKLAWFEVNWNQLYAVTVAIDIMGERAREGCAAAANWAARKTRENLIDAASEHSTLPRANIEGTVEIAAKADEAHTAAMVRVNQEPAPLNLFDNHPGAGGIFVTTDPTKGERFIPEGFYASGSLSEGIYQRAVQNGHRAGRLPIEEKFGPSVVDTLQDTPGLMERQIDDARQELTFAVMRARDIVVSEFVDRFPPPITEDDPRMNYSTWSKTNADFEDHSLLTRIANRVLQ